MTNLHSSRLNIFYKNMLDVAAIAAFVISPSPESSRDDWRVSPNVL